MKALVISDRSEIYNNVTPVLKEKGFDIIHYKWIIKALDNIEEIQPDLIVLSAGEYPRHWKTLAGFVQSGIGGNDVKMYLYETTPLSEEDQKKAADLGILSFEEFETVAEVNEEHLFRNVDIAYNDNSGLLHLASAKYYEDENVKTSIDSAIDYLSKSQRAGGYYAFGNRYSSDTCSQVILALTSLGIDPRTDENRHFRMGVVLARNR